jgi:hypothetical protein
MSGDTQTCPGCGEHALAGRDFICRFCFGRLPSSYKRKLHLSRGRVEEPKKKDEALRWLRREKGSISGT